MQAVSFLGLLVMLVLAWSMSNNKRIIPWRTVITGTLLQIIFALIILRTPIGRAFFIWLSDVVTVFLDFSDAGARFIFGDGFSEHFFAFKVLPTIIFFSSVITILYYLGILQFIVKIFAKIMMKVMGTSGAESLASAVNVFVGQTEAPLLIRPYVPFLTQSELMAVMVGGFSNIAGGVLAAYVGMGVRRRPPDRLLGDVGAGEPPDGEARFPGDRAEPLPRATVTLEVERPWANVIDAAAEGAIEGMKLALNVAAMLIAFIALVALFNAVPGARSAGWSAIPTPQPGADPGLPLAPPRLAHGRALEGRGRRRVAPRHQDGAQRVRRLRPPRRWSRPASSTERSPIIATYALCGFANFSSIAIQIGGIGAMAPSRKADLARLGLKAMVAGSLATFQTATIAGMLL